MAETAITTSRRKFLTFSSAALAITAAPLTAETITHSPYDEWVNGLSALHPKAGKAARHAIAGGMRPDWLYSVLIMGDNKDIVSLLFKRPDGSLVNFSDDGEETEPARAAPEKEQVSVANFGAACNGVSDDTAEVQAAIDYCAANNWPDLIIPGRCYCPGGLNIDREVDAQVDEFYIIGTGKWGGFITDKVGPIFSSTYAVTVNPLSEFVTFKNIRFEAGSSTLAAYAVDGEAFLRMRFDSCFFYRMKCAKTSNYLQQYIVHNCNIRCIQGWFLEATTGGASPFAGSVLHLNWTDNTFEKGSKGIAITGFVKGATQIAGANFAGGIFQGNEGPFYETAKTVGVNFKGIYFELNTKPEILLGVCMAAAISGCLFDNPLDGGDKFCVDASGVQNLKSSGNYASNWLYSAPPTVLGATDSGLVSEGDSAAVKLVENLPGAGAMSGSFTGALSGFTTMVTPTVKYQKDGRTITLSWDDTYATSNATTMALTDIPAALLPTGQNVWVSIPALDNGVLLGMTKANVAVDGITIYKTFDTAGVTFTASGTKGITAFTLKYRI